MRFEYEYFIFNFLIFIFTFTTSFNSKFFVVRNVSLWAVTGEQTMSNKKIIKIPKVIEMTGLSKSTIYVLISRGEFPAQIKLSERASGWLESSIDEWIDTRQKGCVNHA